MLVALQVYSPVSPSCSCCIRRLPWPSMIIRPSLWLLRDFENNKQNIIAEFCFDQRLHRMATIKSVLVAVSPKQSSTQKLISILEKNYNLGFPRRNTFVTEPQRQGGAVFEPRDLWLFSVTVTTVCCTRQSNRTPFPQILISGLHNEARNYSLMRH